MRETIERLLKLHAELVREDYESRLLATGPHLGRPHRGVLARVIEQAADQKWRGYRHTLAEVVLALDTHEDNLRGYVINADWRKLSLTE